MCRSKILDGEVVDQAAQQSAGRIEVGTALPAPPTLPALLLHVGGPSCHPSPERTKLKQEEGKSEHTLRNLPQSVAASGRVGPMRLLASYYEHAPSNGLPCSPLALPGHLTQPARRPALFQLPQHRPRPSLPPWTNTGVKTRSQSPGTGLRAPGRLGQAAQKPMQSTAAY